ncbi:hydrolase TatD [Sulfolobales archaeon SCGC AB-777_J03]|nr:hydrolase TatD [Sulfolobales archaeon SCGC AB-777_J03]
MLFDGHAHIDSEEFKGKVEDVINECNIIVFNASVDFDSSIKTLELASRVDNLFPALGFHPEFVKKSDEVPKVLDLLDFALEVSEVGLDYYWIKDRNLMMKEIKILKNFLEQAEKRNLPVVLHSRGGNRDLLDLLPSYKVRFAIHAFEGSTKHARAFVDLGGYISVPPILVRDKVRAEAVKAVDLAYLLTETDSPFMGSEKGEVNRPCNVIKAIQKIAEIKGMKTEDVEAEIEKNAKRFLGVSDWFELREKKREKIENYLYTRRSD